MARRPMMAANWKMNKTIREAEQYAAALLPRAADAEAVDVAVFVPFTCLHEVGQMAEDTRVVAGAQNFYHEDSGAFTGEVSVPMLQDALAEAGIVGHSERREVFGEDDDLVARKTARAIEAGLLARGLRRRDQGGARRRRDVGEGLRAGAAGDGGARRPRRRLLVFAYEPIWAIGTGDTATPEDAQEAIGQIRGLLEEIAGEDFAERVRILYGGSVKPDNVAEIMAQDDVDGALVGGASLEVESFMQLVEAAQESRVGGVMDRPGPPVIQ